MRRLSERRKKSFGNVVLFDALAIIAERSASTATTATWDVRIQPTLQVVDNGRRRIVFDQAVPAERITSADYRFDQFGGAVFGYRSRKSRDPFSAVRKIASIWRGR